MNAENATLLTEGCSCEAVWGHDKNRLTHQPCGSFAEAQAIVLAKKQEGFAIAYVDELPLSSLDVDEPEPEPEPFILTAVDLLILQRAVERLAEHSDDDKTVGVRLVPADGGALECKVLHGAPGAADELMTHRLACTDDCHELAGQIYYLCMTDDDRAALEQMKVTLREKGYPVG